MWPLQEFQTDKPPMPVELLSKLVCSLCKGYLAVFPIHISEEGVKPICGRCIVPSSPKYLRDTAYEGISKFLRFPCMHHQHGCKELLLPEQLGLHEPRCVFRHLECPTKVTVNCKWKGSCLELRKHYETSHKNCILTERKFTLDFTKDIDLQAIIVFQDEVFITKISMLPECEVFFCFIEHVPQKKHSYYYKYFIKVETSSAAAAYSFAVRHTAGDKCALTQISREKMNETFPNAKKLIAVFELVQEDMDSLRKIEISTVNFGKDIPLQLDQLENFRCEKCFLYMIPPFKQCSSGHKMCTGCNMEATCRICKSPISTNESVQLVQCAGTLMYPCRYKDEGCRVALLNSLIRIHEESCMHKLFECPLRDTLKCKTRSTAPVTVYHINTHHSTNVMSTDVIRMSVEEARQKTTSTFLIIYSGRVFQVIFRFFKGVFTWAAVIIASASEAKKFKLEVDIIDSSGRNLCIVARALCSSADEGKAYFEMKERHISLLPKQLDLFYHNGKLCFKIIILNSLR